MDESTVFPPEINTSRPAAARIYDFGLGGKDNFAVDREWCLAMAQRFPEGLDIARENRLFLYRAVRYLARDAGITQFLDLGSGLPTQNNVHQVAQRFRPDTRVVYVDNDPIVLAHGRALLADDSSTTVITADLAASDEIMGHPEVRELLDFSQPIAVLMFSIPHLIPDDSAAIRGISEPMRRVVSGSYLAVTHVVANDEATAAQHTRDTVELGLEWKTRMPRDLDAWLGPEGLGLEPVEPGLCDISTWRPDPTQPPLSPVAPEIQPYLGASQTAKRVHEYGGVLRKP